MRPTPLRLSIVASASLCLAASTHARDFASSPDDRAALARGEAVVQVQRDPGGASGRIEAAIEIPAPPEAVWRVMLDCDRAVRFVENLKSCRVLQRDPAGQWEVREHIASPSILLPDFRSVFRSDYDTPHRIGFRQVEGDFDVMEGQWVLQPDHNGAGTLLLYTARIGIALPVPGFILRTIIETEAPDTLKSLRAEVLRSVASGGGQTP